MAVLVLLVQPGTHCFLVKDVLLAPVQLVVHDTLQTFYFRVLSEDKVTLSFFYSFSIQTVMKQLRN